MSDKQLSITEQELDKAIRVTSQPSNDIFFDFDGVTMADGETIEDYRIMVRKVIANYVRRAYSGKECEYGYIKEGVLSHQIRATGYLDPLGTYASRQAK